MDTYSALMIIIFILLSALSLRQKIKTDMKKKSFELENGILKDKVLFRTKK